MFAALRWDRPWRLLRGRQARTLPVRHQSTQLAACRRLYDNEYPPDGQRASWSGSIGAARRKPDDTGDEEGNTGEEEARHHRPPGL